MIVISKVSTNITCVKNVIDNPNTVRNVFLFMGAKVKKKRKILVILVCCLNLIIKC